MIIARTPCYGLSEIRRVRTKKIPDLEHLVNVVAFPKRGRRPLTNVLSGGDLDGDLYFVSWDHMLTSFENVPSTIEYPKSGEMATNKRLENAEAIRSELVNHFVGTCLRDDSIGLMHYSLVCMYDSDRNKMRSREYLDQLININRAIDQQAIVPSTSSKTFHRRPIW